MQHNKICSTCGTHYTEIPADGICTICKDDRQYLPEGGQKWTTPAELDKHHGVRISKVGENIYELVVIPKFAISQRALLVLSAEGNILWDCVPLLNEPAIEFIRSKGGLKAIAFSHPHYYSNMNDWAAAFDCPVYIHRSDQQWIVNHGPNIRLWSGEEEHLWEGIRIINIGGHFPGSSILHVPNLSALGTIFSGDTIHLSPSMRHLSVMYSYPNQIPLPRTEMKRIKKRFENIQFDALYGVYGYQNLTVGAREVLHESLERYLV
ncbi:MBL fold metallo-hydrolase [Fulvivirga ulvae]|uniref:MBL fold metallo-hydrolase n=1 Tax=Fulvivirga ulvae TaxID=2904245 RepID=UPI001F29E174|nr:MBL fold metallo-hydrolase [Fulvivirga ulvae]UII30703.1 MBL fold metallo-hydrolase [Fulvivirga ulvae]